MLSTSARALRQRASELCEALDKDQLRLHFQPVVRMADGAITGAEALLRWKHPQRGLLGPHHVIPAAEASGLISPIGDWVLDSALRQAGRWSHRHPRLKMAVNIAASQLHTPAPGGFADRVAELMSRHRLSARNVCLEVTETMALSAARGDLEALNEVRQLGVQVALDDFATGHCLPRTLEQIDADVLKIDRSHVHAIRSYPAARDVVRHMLLLARKLQMATVVEGVETHKDDRVLRNMGATHAQGFGYCPPVDVPAFTRLLHDGHLQPPSAGAQPRQ